GIQNPFRANVPTGNRTSRDDGVESPSLVPDGVRAGEAGLSGFMFYLRQRVVPFHVGGRDMPTWRDRGFGMWPLYDKRGLPWPLFDKQGRPRTWVVIPLFVSMTAAWILVAIAFTLYSGLAYAAIYWILSGFFLLLLAAGLFVFLMNRR